MQTQKKNKKTWRCQHKTKNSKQTKKHQLGDVNTKKSEFETQKLGDVNTKQKVISKKNKNDVMPTQKNEFERKKTQ